ncbi:MAG TPA: hypothetical protein VEC16_06665 [Alphaproteobacteria bacterium]|nr:hypothetical protein [Alphaproteobacteria bacterium]
MKDKEIQELIAKGHIHCRVIFEMAGSPKEHVESTLKKYINAIKEDPSYIFLDEEYAPAEENEKIWSTFCEAEIIVENLEKLNILCFNLGPASIEILQPEKMELSEKRLGEVYTDLISKIQEIGMTMKGLNSENELLKKNLSRSIRNNIMLGLGSESMTLEEISEKVGIGAEHLKPFADAMIKENSIVVDGDKYSKKK